MRRSVSGPCEAITTCSALYAVYTTRPPRSLQPPTHIPVVLHDFFLPILIILRLPAMLHCPSSFPPLP